MKSLRTRCRRRVVVNGLKSDFVSLFCKFTFQTFDLLLNAFSLSCLTKLLPDVGDYHDRIRSEALSESSLRKALSLAYASEVRPLTCLSSLLLHLCCRSYKILFCSTQVRHRNCRRSPASRLHQSFRSSSLYLFDFFSLSLENILSHFSFHALTRFEILNIVCSDARPSLWSLILNATLVLSSQHPCIIAEDAVPRFLAVQCCSNDQLFFISFSCAKSDWVFEISWV